MKNNLRELRKGKGWSQGVLAQKLRVSRQTINSIETGRYEASLSLALRIARLFEMPVERIFDDRIGEIPAADGVKTVPPEGDAVQPTPSSPWTDESLVTVSD